MCEPADKSKDFRGPFQDLCESVVSKIIVDLTDRRELCPAWNSIHVDIQADIVKVWEDIVKSAMEKFERAVEPDLTVQEYCAFMRQWIKDSEVDTGLVGQSTPRY